MIICLRGRGNSTLPHREEIRRTLRFKPDDFVFMFSGKMIPKKNPLIIPDALRLVQTLQDIGFLGVGDGELRNTFENRMQELLGDSSLFTGFVNQSQLGKFYAAADALILPSASETWGLVVNEAQIFGLPVIVSDTVGCREDLVIPGRTGTIFPAGNPSALANSIYSLFSNREDAGSMGENGKRLIKGYDVASAVKGVIAALEYVAKN